MLRAVVVAVLVSCATALAQDDTPDANSIPDASVGQGGAGRDSQEQDDSAARTCLSSADCDQGFVCRGGRCEYQRYRDATFEGCGCHAAAPAALVFGLALGPLARRPRRRRRWW